MSKTPVTVYLDFKTATILKARAESLRISQSQWMGDCVKQALLADRATAPSILGGHDYMHAVTDVWIEMQPNPEAVVERIRQRMDEREAHRAATFRFTDLGAIAR
jgi:hypothetical protein